jgi:predicted AlkP superfamily pyrophosphatase or phosphodiesterase
MQESALIPVMRIYRSLVVVCLLLVLVSSAFAAERITNLRPTVILVSIDGFRPDYLNKVETPNLHSIMARGTHAKYMIPSFPTKTFPNHYTIVTGLYPAHHGIVANNIYDPDMNARFKTSDRAAVTDARWWGGEPIWVTAEKQGVRTAPLLWPGALAKEEGVEPAYNMEWNDKLPNEERIAKLVSLLDLPVSDRPQFLTLYFDLVDHAGHDFGPTSPEVRQAVEAADKGIGELLAALRERGIEEQVNLIVVSDHGMSPVSAKRNVVLDDYLDMQSVEVVDVSPVLALRPKDGNVEALYEKVKHVPHAKAYLATNTPQRWHFSDNHRITPVILVADDEWSLNSREWLKTHQVKGGAHGYDNESKNMRALFIAAGPAFLTGTMKPFANIHVYSLLAYLLSLTPAKTDGSLDVFRPVLAERSSEPVKKVLAPWQKEWDEVALNQELVVRSW